MNTPETRKKKHRKPSAPAGYERMAAMAERIGFSPSTVYSWIADEKMAFPRPLKLTKNVALFLTAAVNAWLAERGLMQAPVAAL